MTLPRQFSHTRALYAYTCGFEREMRGQNVTQDSYLRFLPKNPNLVWKFISIFYREWWANKSIFIPRTQNCTSLHFIAPYPISSILSYSMILCFNLSNSIFLPMSELLLITPFSTKNLS